MTTRRLFDDLERADVGYCHFKSNAHLVEGLRGMTDLDLVVDAERAATAEEVLGRNGFKRFRAHPSRSYPGVDDWLGVDETSGRLLHLQVHYRLVLGERYFKNYHLAWERRLLERRVRHPETGVFVADPAFESLLLLCRAALKLRWRDRLAGRLVPHPGELADLHREFGWLAERADPGEVVSLARELVGDDTAGLVADLLASDSLPAGRLLPLRRALLASPVLARGYGSAAAALLRWRRETRSIVGGVNRRYLHRAFPYARSAPGGGTVIAVVGSDGSGKSTVTRGLQTWLAGKVDVLPIYFGSGQGRPSLLRLPLTLALRVIPRSAGGTKLDPEERRRRPVTPSRAVWALVLAHEKRSKLRLAERARERGFVVVCDRYPQTEVDGVNDGPLLAGWRDSRSALRRSLAGWERRVYERARETPPDYLVRLDVSPEVASARREDHDLDDLRYRTELVRRLRFASARRGVIEVDADRDADSVVREVKRRVWPGL